VILLSIYLSLNSYQLKFEFYKQKSK
jgi:hypothetical protein